mmetsp:Transcript_26191/g.73075  ORF Transcript_26191/g.73075 Transcript_26191/m.73075 type:complete len:270 (+) Transcript_26191:2582-3391(+)
MMPFGAKARARIPSRKPPRQPPPPSWTKWTAWISTKARIRRPSRSSTTANAGLPFKDEERTIRTMPGDRIKRVAKSARCMGTAAVVVAPTTSDRYPQEAALTEEAMAEAMSEIAIPRIHGTKRIEIADATAIGTETETETGTEVEAETAEITTETASVTGIAIETEIGINTAIETVVIVIVIVAVIMIGRGTETETAATEIRQKLPPTAPHQERTKAVQILEEEEGSEATATFNKTSAVQEVTAMATEIITARTTPEIPRTMASANGGH